MHPPPQPESASRRAASPRRSVGCMAGILRLISPYHRSHHRKRLTAKNAAAQAPGPPPPSTPTNKRKEAALAPALLSPLPSPVKPVQLQPTAAAVGRRRRSCDAPRSPTVAPENRRVSCDSPRSPPSVIVARLMGLEGSAPPSPATAPRPVVIPTRPPPPPPAPETAAEKRRKLLGALEKCDEDLKTLRRIIAAVRAAEMRAVAASDAAPMSGTPSPGKDAKWMIGRTEQSPSPSPAPHKPRAEEQYPSPDSVLDAISSPRFPCRKRPPPCTDLEAGGKASSGNGAVVPAVGSKIVKPSRTLVFSGDHRKTKAGDEWQPHGVVGGGARHHHPVAPAVATTVEARLPRAAGAESWRYHRRRLELEAAAAGRVISRATVESVEEAWGQPAPQGRGGGCASEQRWEAGRVAAAVERAMVHDLVADVVAELVAQSGHGGAAGCRKRLCF